MPYWSIQPTAFDDPNNMVKRVKLAYEAAVRLTRVWTYRSQSMAATTRQIPARKLRAVLSYRVAMAGQSLRRQNARLIARSVGGRIEGGWRKASRPCRDDSFGALAAEEVAQVVDVVCLVGDQLTHRRHGCQQRSAVVNVVDLACCQHHGVEAIGAVGERVDLGGRAAARATDGLVLLPNALLASAIEAVEQRRARPYSAGIVRQRRPSRYLCRMPLRTRRSSTRGLPPSFESSGSIAGHCVSLNQNRSAMLQSSQSIRISYAVTEAMGTNPKASTKR